MSNVRLVIFGLLVSITTAVVTIAVMRCIPTDMGACSKKATRKVFREGRNGKGEFKGRVPYLEDLSLEFITDRYGEPDHVYETTSNDYGVNELWCFDGVDGGRYNIMVFMRNGAPTRITRFDMEHFLEESVLITASPL